MLNSLQALANVASNIRAGYYDIGIAGGVESMTNGPRDKNMWAKKVSD